MRKQESIAAGEYAAPVGRDALLEASLANQPSMVPKNPKKEHGVSIRTDLAFT